MTIYHVHHIVPRHMGGTDNPENLVKLTVEEHAMAHLKLYQEHGKIEDLWAYQLLSAQISYGEGLTKVLSKNARDTHRKQRERGTGVFDSKMQSEKGKVGALKSNLGKTNNPNYIKLTCLGCKKETSVPTFFGHHSRTCF